MSDAEDTEAVPSTPQVTAATVPITDAPQPEDVPINVPPAEIANPSTEGIKSPNVPSKHNAVEIPENGKGPREDEKQAKESNKTDSKKLQPSPLPQSRCKARSRDMRQCKKHYREMIGKHEIRNDELGQRETDLRQRLEMLECSMPAVMVWNIWRMAQGAPVSHLRDIVEKQFLKPAAGSATCPSTPSQHWDCRVREVEAERKQALHRAEEARQVFSVKGDALKFQKHQIEEARRLQEERKMQITKLEEEVKRLQDALKKAQGDENFCETGECGETQCRQMWLQGVSSVSSIHSTDLECLARLQDLAEAELCMKRQIADLERRECAYMRTLQQADEMWGKMEDDNASNLGDLKDQLDAKIAANQQLADRIVELEDEIEKLRTQLTRALATLDEYTGKTFVDIGLGDVNVSTEEKTEQTEDEAKEIKDSEESEAEDIVVTKGATLSKINVAKAEEIEQLRDDEAEEYTPIEESDQKQLEAQKTVDKSSIVEETKGEIKDPRVVDGQPNYEQIQVTAKINTTEESVQAKPEFEEAETQVTKAPSLEKETATEERTQAETATITEPVGVESTPTTTEISPKVSIEHLAEQQQGISVLEEASKAKTKSVPGLVVDADGSHPFKDKASLNHLLKTPTEDEDTGVSVAARTEDNPTPQGEAFQVALEAAAEPTSRPTAEPAYEKTSEATVKTLSGLTDEVVRETTPEPAQEPVAKVSIEAASEPTAEALGVTPSGLRVHSSREPGTEATPITSPKLHEKTVPEVVSEANPIIFPISSMEDIARPVIEPVTEPTIDAAPIPSPEPSVKNVERPVSEPTPGVVEPVQIQLAENTSIVPIQTLMSWHNITACLYKQISNCPQCSSTSEEIGQMLGEMRIYLGKDAPDLAKIECARVAEEVQNAASLPTKKGPCICKPKTCPLDGTPTTVPAQANVQIQTVVDGQSQTSMLTKISNREIRSPKSSKGSTKSKEEERLTSIEEGTEPDPAKRRTTSMPEARDESTVTVGEMSSQTETIRKAPSASKDEAKPCVCPTGVCPKKKAKPPCGECASGKICTSRKNAQGKEYKSIADAILAPAIKVLPSNEPASSPPTGDAKAEDLNSESSAFACCMCGKPVTPVASRKTTSIPMPTKSVYKGKVISASEDSEDDFLCCSCRVKDFPSTRQKYSSARKSSEKSPEVTRVSHRVKPASEAIKTSCSREICCSCDKQEVHILTKTLTTDLEVRKSKTRPETKDVCCLAKISRDKVSKTEARRRKDNDSTKTATPSASRSGSGHVSLSSSTYKGSRINDSSDSNVCCSSLEQVIDMTKKKGKGRKCACDGQEGKSNKEGCVCGEGDETTVTKQGKHTEPGVSCSCSSKLFDEC